MFRSILPNLRSPPRIKNARGVAIDLMLTSVVSSITGISKPIRLRINEKTRPETPPITKGFLTIPRSADLRLLFSASLNA